MRQKQNGVVLALAALIAVGTLAGVWTARKRWRVEVQNRRVEIGVEWAEVSQLAQVSGHPLSDVLTRFKAQQVSTLILAEETLATLESRRSVEPTPVSVGPDGGYYTKVAVRDERSLRRITDALTVRGLTTHPPTEGTGSNTTLFYPPDSKVAPFAVEMSYTNLRTLGLGLPPEAVAAARTAGMRIAGRVGNFAGVTAQSAERVLKYLKKQGASLVIFTGDEVLGYRGLEKEVASLLRSPDAPALPDALPATGLRFGAVEFSKQKGDEKIGAVLHGDYVRVHSIQTAEMGQLDETEAIERYVRGVKERNIRFCYVRLFTQAGDDILGDNVAFLQKIAQGIDRGGTLTGGGLEFGASRPYEETEVGKTLFVLLALGVAAGTVWLFRTFCPLEDRLAWFLLALLGILYGGMVLAAGETGRKVVALLAGIVFPATACLRTFPLTNGETPARNVSALWGVCISRTLASTAFASGITVLGIFHVIGLLATRPFLVRANQFLGIKAQHVVPLFIVGFVALIGGLPGAQERFRDFRNRTAASLRRVWDEPARFGLLIAAGIGLAALLLIVARTGNDAGVGVSGIEMKLRAVLDRVLPVRPRTKEFLVGHPAFVLGLALWWRGRRRLSLPCLVVGSIGQVSLLNTFCHIHTPLMVSVWRGGLGLFFGILLGILLFFGVDLFVPMPSAEAEARRTG